MVPPAFGHMNPVLPAAAELVRRGERVVFYSSHKFERLIALAGAEYRPYRNLPSVPTQRSPRVVDWLPLMIEATDAFLRPRDRGDPGRAARLQLLRLHGALGRRDRASGRDPGHGLDAGTDLERPKRGPASRIMPREAPPTFSWRRRPGRTGARSSRRRRRTAGACSGELHRQRLPSSDRPTRAGGGLHRARRSQQHPRGAATAARARPSDRVPPAGLGPIRNSAPGGSGRRRIGPASGAGRRRDPGGGAARDRGTGPSRRSAGVTAAGGAERAADAMLVWAEAARG